MRPCLRARYLPWCAVIVLALLAASLLHAAAPHDPVQRDCSTCKALSAPGIAEIVSCAVRPFAEPSAITPLPSSRPTSDTTRYLRPLRAPPKPPIF